MIYGPYQHEVEFSKLLWIFNELNPTNVLEIGSLHGHTLREFIKRMQPESKFTSIDMLIPENDYRYTEQKQGHDSDWSLFALEHKVKFQLIEYSSTDPRSFDLVKEFTPKLDFLFIDGDHAYETAKSDFLTYSTTVRRGGVIALHDISPNEATSSVWKLWDEIKYQYPNQTEQFLFDPTGKGIGILHV